LGSSSARFGVCATTRRF
jgi:hypothetical protein